LAYPSTIERKKLNESESAAYPHTIEKESPDDKARDEFLPPTVEKKFNLLYSDVCPSTTRREMQEDESNDEFLPPTIKKNKLVGSQSTSHPSTLKKETRGDQSKDEFLPPTIEKKQLNESQSTSYPSTIKSDKQADQSKDESLPPTIEKKFNVLQSNTYFYPSTTKIERQDDESEDGFLPPTIEKKRLIFESDGLAHSPTVAKNEPLIELESIACPPTVETNSPDTKSNGPTHSATIEKERQVDDAKSQVFPSAIDKGGLGGDVKKSVHSLTGENEKSSLASERLVPTNIFRQSETTRSTIGSGETENKKRKAEEKLLALAAKVARKRARQKQIEEESRPKPGLLRRRMAELEEANRPKLGLLRKRMAELDQIAKKKSVLDKTTQSADKIDGCDFNPDLISKKQRNLVARLIAAEKPERREGCNVERFPSGRDHRISLEEGATRSREKIMDDTRTTSDSFKLDTHGDGPSTKHERVSRAEPHLDENPLKRKEIPSVPNRHFDIKCDDTPEPTFASDEKQSDGIASNLNSFSTHLEEVILPSDVLGCGDDSKASHGRFNENIVWKELMVVDDLADDIYDFDSESDDGELSQTEGEGDFQKVVDDLADGIYEDSDSLCVEEKHAWEDMPDLDDIKFGRQNDRRRDKNVTPRRSSFKGWSSAILDELLDDVGAQMEDIPDMDDHNDPDDHDYDSDGNEGKEVANVNIAYRILNLLRTDYPAWGLRGEDVTEKCIISFYTVVAVAASFIGMTD